MMAMEQHRVLSDQIEIVVHTAGAGPPVLLLHGFPDDHEVWEKQIPALVEAGYRVLAPDTRGCGLSSIPGSVADYCIEHLIADMIAVLDHFEVGKASLVAHDWGAMIAWRLAIAHPERFERFATLSVGHPATLGAAGLRQVLKSYYIFLFQIRGLGEWLMRRRDWAMVRGFSGSPNEAERAVARLSRPGRLTAGINYYRANLRMFRDRNVPHCTAMPVLGIASDNDPYITDLPLRETAHFVDGPYRFELIPGAGHWIQRDAPQAVNRLLLDFLGGGGAQQGSQ